MPDNDFPDLADLKAACLSLQVALDEALLTHDQLDLASTDTVLAVGLATGAISKAVALLNRDINNLTPQKLPPLVPQKLLLNGKAKDQGTSR